MRRLDHAPGAGEAGPLSLSALHQPRRLLRLPDKYRDNKSLAAENPQLARSSESPVSTTCYGQRPAPVFFKITELHCKANVEAMLKARWAPICR